MITTECEQDESQWHRWWAWYPVSTRPVLKGDQYCWNRAWLEFVWCRYREDIWGDRGWEYRLENPAGRP